MKIAQFIQQSFQKRADKDGALIVYDPDRRLRAIVRAMADGPCMVLDATESFIEAQEKTIEWWAKAGDPANGERRLVVYVPMAAPGTAEQCCHDPFSGIAAGAARFPAGDEDTFQVLCERAKPEQKDKIRNLFAEGNPDLATLEAVGGGNNWPQLETLLGVESITDMIQSLLAPSPEQADRMKAGEGWVAEAKEMLAAQTGFQAKTKSKKWEAVVDELWRFLLFSEFAYDLPGALPTSLADVPVALPGSGVLIYRVCETLRQEKWCTLYIDRANQVAKHLQLEERMRDVEDLGPLDTFAFEERTFLRRYVRRLLAGELAVAAEIAAKRKDSVWVKHTDRGILWTIAERARELLIASEDLEKAVPAAARSLDDLIGFYASRGYRLDQTHREMEQAVADAHWETEGVEELVEAARSRHHTVAEKLQKQFVEAVSKEGWPAASKLRATQIFDKTVSPLLEVRGKRVAYFMVDALRFELAVALERQLAPIHTCRLQPACAQLPTVTPVGMAALLPKAEGNLFLKLDGTELVPMLGGTFIRNPDNRRDYVQAIYGDRVRMMDLDSVVMLNVGSKKKISSLDGVELLLVKTTEIDELGELDAVNVCVELPKILARIIAAIGKLKRLGFHHAVFVTDHGFVLHTDTSPGNTVGKPPGDWLEVKDRCLLGRGSGSPDTLAWRKEHVGIVGDFEIYVVPKTFGTFSERHPYFHEGLSLPEAVIPVLEVDLAEQAAKEGQIVEVQLRYRGESTGVVTTHRPFLEVAVFGGDFFTKEITIRLEVRMTKNGGDNIVGEAASCQYVDPATGFLRLTSGLAVKVPLRIDEDFTGAFEVRAVDAETGVVYGSPLKLRAETIA